MKVVALRARARCQVCDSKLPPRTEAFWEEETRTAICLTCARTTGIQETPSPPPVATPPAPPVPVARAPVAPAPVAPATVAPVPVAPAPVAEPLPEPLPPVMFSASSADGEPSTENPPLRPPLSAPVRARPPLDGPRDRRPPLADVEDRRPPPAPESLPPLPPRLPAAPVLPPRTPVGEADGAAATTGRAPAARSTVGPLSAVEPDVDDEPQWGEPSGPPNPHEPGGDQSRHVRASAGLIGRLRNVANVDAGALVDGDVLVDDLPMNDGVERGDPGDTIVGKALEAARASGIEVLHHLAVAPGETIDHLVVAVNGLWVIRSEASLAGPLERRDLGDWFTADPRLYVGETDRSDLVNDARDRAGTLRRFLASTSYADIPVRTVVTFGDVPAGWVGNPFSLAGVSVTWGSGLVEPMLDPVMVDKVTRAQLLQLLVDAARLY